jgi:multicomponent K+:H+ antiporter subunit D
MWGALMGDAAMGDAGMWDALSAAYAQHAPMVSVLLPALTAILLLLLGGDSASAELGMQHGARALRWRRCLALTSTLLGAGLALGLLLQAQTGVLQIYRLGDWPAPFGIVLVADRLAALMLALTYTLALPVLYYATGGWDQRGRYFHALFQFQLMGLSGAFLTGDLFNLFVFFEVLLIASYALLVHGQGRERIQVGLHYGVLNLAGSALFLIALAMVYASTGTLNMADLALRVPQLHGDTARLAQSAALLLLVVFGLKAAMVPLSFWLPASYTAASAPVAALFAVMSKVGVYSMVRVHWVIFGVHAGEAARTAEPWLLPLALATSVIGVLGALAAHSMGRLVAYLAISSVGTILMAVGLLTPAALSAGLYYAVHSTVVTAALFLLVEQIAAQRGATQDHLQPAPAVREPVLLGFLLLLGAASVAGLPPLPGFLGKLMVLQSSATLPAQGWVWSGILGVGFCSMLALARAGVVVFWHVQPDSAHALPTPGSSPRLRGCTIALLAVSIAMAVWAAPLQRYTWATAQQLSDQSLYTQAVLGDNTLRSSRPYNGLPSAATTAWPASPPPATTTQPFATPPTAPQATPNTHTHTHTHTTPQDATSASARPSAAVTPVPQP